MIIGFSREICFFTFIAIIAAAAFCAASAAVPAMSPAECFYGSGCDCRCDNERKNNVCNRHF